MSDWSNSNKCISVSLFQAKVCKTPSNYPSYYWSFSWNNTKQIDTEPIELSTAVFTNKTIDFNIHFDNLTTWAHLHHLEINAKCKTMLMLKRSFAKVIIPFNLYKSNTQKQWYFLKDDKNEIVLRVLLAIESNVKMTDLIKSSIKDKHQNYTDCIQRKSDNNSFICTTVLHKKTPSFQGPKTGVWYWETTNHNSMTNLKVKANWNNISMIKTGNYGINGVNQAQLKYNNSKLWSIMENQRDVEYNNSSLNNSIIDVEGDFKDKDIDDALDRKTEQILKAQSQVDMETQIINELNERNEKCNALWVKDKAYYNEITKGKTGGKKEYDKTIKVWHDKGGRFRSNAKRSSLSKENDIVNRAFFDGINSYFAMNTIGMPLLPYEESKCNHHSIKQGGSSKYLKKDYKNLKWNSTNFASNCSEINSEISTPPEKKEIEQIKFPQKSTIILSSSPDSSYHNNNNTSITPTKRAKTKEVIDFDNIKVIRNHPKNRNTLNHRTIKVHTDKENPSKPKAISPKLTGNNNKIPHTNNNNNNNNNNNKHFNQYNLKKVINSRSGKNIFHQKNNSKYSNIAIIPNNNNNNNINKNNKTHIYDTTPLNNPI